MKNEASRPKLLVISHVSPYPGLTGQQQRVAYMLRGMRERFHVSFVTADTPVFPNLAQQLPEMCDELHLLPSRYSGGLLTKAFHQGAARAYSWSKGLRPSSYLVGKLEFSPARLASVAASGQYDLVMLEYWMATASLVSFKSRGIPCVLDMHDILWQTFKRDLDKAGSVPAPLRQWAIERYRRQEEAAWRQFDGLIAINHAELSHVAEQVPHTTKLFHAAMGVDLTQWAFDWKPQQHPPRLAYYGGFGNPANRADAMICYHHLMPAIWQRFPNAELWLVGSNPSAELQALTDDPRIKVTGFVKDAPSILRTMTAVLCPFNGTFGFRSRLIEVMALGVPVVASPDAVYGMEMEVGHGVLLGASHEELIQAALRLLEDREFASEQSLSARQQVEERFSMQATYGQLANELADWLQRRSFTQ